MSPILVTLTSRGDSNFEGSDISRKENKRDGIHLNSNGLDYCVGKNEGKFLWFSADCMTVKTEMFDTDEVKGLPPRADNS